MTLKQNKKNEQGFIALISAVIISALLITITVALGTSSFLSRFNILDAEYKEKSSALAEACADAAILKLAASASYPGGETIAVGSDTCKVISVVPVAGWPKTIKTQATVSNSYTDLTIGVSNTATVSVDSWQEVPHF